MQARAHRAYGCAHRASNLLHREVTIEAEDDGDSLIGIELPEGTLEGVTLVDLAMGVMRGKSCSRLIQVVVASVSLAAEPVPADVGDDPAEPCVEFGGIAEAGMVPPGSDERVVGRIFGLLCVAEDQASEPVRLVEALIHEPTEGCGSCRLLIARDGGGILAQTGLSF